MGGWVCDSVGRWVNWWIVGGWVGGLISELVCGLVDEYVGTDQWLDGGWLEVGKQREGAVEGLGTWAS